MSSIQDKDVDFINQFTYRTIPKITKEPDYESLKSLKDKIIANASSIQSDLGGGNHGHLGLVLSAAEYANASAVPFVRPPNPGPLVIPPSLTALAEAGQRDDHCEALVLFHRTNALEHILKRQITSAIDKDYIDELKDQTTNTFQLDILTHFNFLFTNYGDIQPEVPKAEEQSILDKKFHISDPLTKLYRRVEDLNQLAIAAQSPYTQQQLINLGLQVIINTDNYERPLEDWYALPLGQTQLQFKNHFSLAQHNMIKVRKATMRHKDYQTADQMSEDITDVKRISMI